VGFLLPTWNEIANSSFFLRVSKKHCFPYGARTTLCAMVTWANNATRIILNVLNGVMVVGGPGSVVDLVEIFMDAWNLDYM